jgi:hypothetical protein
MTSDGITLSKESQFLTTKKTKYTKTFTHNLYVKYCGVLSLICCSRR